MGDDDAERTLPAEDLEAMVRVVAPEWRLLEVTFVEDGMTAIYRLGVDTPTGDRACYLKATPFPDRPAGLATEARLTEVVRRHTDCPVPRVIGAVDEHDALRAPYFLMEAMDGTRQPMDALVELPARHVRSLARQTGRYLAQLHDLPVTDLTAYGQRLSHDADAALRGDRPSGDPAELAFAAGHGRWRDQLRDWIDEDLEVLAATERFSDLVEPVGAALEPMVDALPDSPTPAVGRVDHGLWNLLTDDSGDELRAMLDWGSLFVVPPAFDLAVVEYLLAGGPWMGLEDVPDHRPGIREAMLAGYREDRPVPAGYDAQRRCYQLETAILSLVSIDDGPERPRHLPADRLDEAAAGMRALVRELIG